MLNCAEILAFLDIENQKSLVDPSNRVLEAGCSMRRMMTFLFFLRNISDTNAELNTIIN